MGYQTIIIGLGAMGSAAANSLSRRGNRVLGLEQFSRGHQLGSSHGKSRIIREAYFEDPLYVPLVKRSYELWAELEARSGASLLTITGGLMIGAPESAVVRGALASALEYALPYEQLTALDVHRRFPALRPHDDEVAIFEPRAGSLRPEAAIEAQCIEAARGGAQLRFNERVFKWSATASGVEVVTASGTYAAERLVIAAGAWAAQLLPELSLPLAVERNAVYWFEPVDPAPFAPGRLPIFIHEYAPGRTWYGFADFGDGVKAALHHQGEITSAQDVRREVSGREVAYLRELLAEYAPGANGPLRDTTVCLYTNTPDDDFVLDVHPAHPAVFIASPCSGHGFKFSIAIGEVIADALTGVKSRFDLAPFRVSRFAERGIA